MTSSYKIRKYRIDNGLCKGCGIKQEGSSHWCVSCRVKIRNKNRRRCERLVLAGKCRVCAKNEPKRGCSYCNDCAKKQKLSAKLRIRKYFKILLNHYGNQCACCGEKEWGLLTLDHKNNDGYIQRKHWNLGRSTCRVYKKAIDLGFPDDLQILCFSCNCGKARFGGTCPHKLENYA